MKKMCLKVKLKLAWKDCFPNATRRRFYGAIVEEDVSKFLFDSNLQIWLAVGIHIFEEESKSSKSILATHAASEIDSNTHLNKYTDEDFDENSDENSDDDPDEEYSYKDSDIYYSSKDSYESLDEEL